MNNVIEAYNYKEKPIPEGLLQIREASDIFEYQDYRRINICIPSWNRESMLFESFEKVYNDDRVSNIIIVDDFSDIDLYERVAERCATMPKVKLFRNEKNIDCYANKAMAVSHSTSGWLILLDSDNVVDVDYLDRLYEIKEWDKMTTYTPSFAEPHFDFRAYSDIVLSSENIAKYIDMPMMQTCLNAANFFVKKDTYLSCFNASANPVTSDSIFMAYNMLKNGFKIKILGGLRYEHRVHTGSHYQNNLSKTPVGFHEEILNKLRSLK